MLEKFFAKPQTVDRVRASWIGPEIERYVGWLSEGGYAARTVWHRVPVLVAFGEFAQDRGATVLEDLPVHVDAFVAQWMARQHRVHSRGDQPRVGREVRGPLEQLLRLAIPGFDGHARPHRPMPFADVAPGFFTYLVEERGLRPTSVYSYRYHLDRFQAYLRRIGVRSVRELSPVVLSGHIVERAASGLARSTVREDAGSCGCSCGTCTAKACSHAT